MHLPACLPYALGVLLDTCSVRSSIRPPAVPRARSKSVRRTKCVQKLRSAHECARRTAEHRRRTGARSGRRFAHRCCAPPTPLGRLATSSSRCSCAAAKRRRCAARTVARAKRRCTGRNVGVGRARWESAHFHGRFRVSECCRKGPSGAGGPFGSVLLVCPTALAHSNCPRRIRTTCSQPAVFGEMPR